MLIYLNGGINPNNAKEEQEAINKKENRPIFLFYK